MATDREPAEEQHRQRNRARDILASVTSCIRRNGLTTERRDDDDQKI
jgi:hypothetical protein